MPTRFITVGHGRSRKIIPFRDSNKIPARVPMSTDVGALNVVKRRNSVHVIDGDGKILYSYSGATGEFYGDTMFHDLIITSRKLQSIPKYRTDLAIDMFIRAENLSRAGKLLDASKLKGEWGKYCKTLSDDDHKYVYDYIENLGY